MVMRVRVEATRNHVVLADASGPLALVYRAEEAL
jgi:hypothetical protein